MRSRLLQTSVLHEWSKTWLLSFNISKCYVLYLGHAHSYGNYSINGSVIASTASIKDLVDSYLKFSYHTATITAKANRMLAIISKSSEIWILTMLLQLYKPSVCPILEYGISFGDHNSYLINNQSKRFKEAGAIREIKDLPYLNNLNLPFLRYRRRRGDLIYTYRLLHNRV